MQIDSGALLHLFDTLIIPGEMEMISKVVSQTIEEQELKEPEKVVPKKLTLVFNAPPSAEEEDLLSKILAAIKIQADETTRVISANTSGMLANMNELNGIILSWGASLTNGEKYVVTKNNNLNIIESDSLSIIKLDKNLKAKLWNCLKATFTP